jgi:hypothetical protein
MNKDKTLQNMIIVSLIAASLGLAGGYFLLPRETVIEAIVTPETYGAPSLLFVQKAENGTLTTNREGDTTLSLCVDNLMQFFTDRPDRYAGHETVESFVDAWTRMGFSDDPPNAALVLHTADMSEDVLIVELLDPVYESGVLNYSVRVLDGEVGVGLAYYANQRDESVAEVFSDAWLFIDNTQTQGDTVTLTQLNPYPNEYGLKIIRYSYAAVGEEAREWLREQVKTVNTLGDVFSIQLKSDCPPGVMLIDRPGTQISSEPLSEFDVYMFLQNYDDFENPKTRYLFRVSVGYTVSIQDTMTTYIASPYSGVVKASDGWSSVDGLSVTQGMKLFAVETTTGGVTLTLDTADIIDGSLPYGVERTKIYESQPN